MVTNQSDQTEKINLFRSLFIGREDVYPKRFENTKTNKSGYTPVCGNEWVRGVCEKPKIKCSNCPNQRYLPVTDEVVRSHLLGIDVRGNNFVMGVYPMLIDETCRFLAFDFDKHSWQQDALALLNTCSKLNICTAMERSRSGKSAHVWIFFSEAISAALVRKLGSYLLTETMAQHTELGLDSYDRLFPNQDTLPKGGLGNLIALPLQRKPRLVGNSVFIDENLVPYDDQWNFLSNLHKLNQTDVEHIVAQAETKGHTLGVRLDVSDEESLTPWKKSLLKHNHLPISGALPETLHLVLGGEIFIEKAVLPPALRNHLIRMAAFQNPEFYKTQAMRLPVYGTPRIIGCARDYPNHIGLPRGCLDEIKKLFSDLHIQITIQNELCAGQPLDTHFQGQLRPDQEKAVHAMMKHDMGILSATTAFGKTVIAARLIAQRQTNTLILVHRRQLQEQWKERLLSFLDLPDKSIGKIGGGRKKPTGICDIALIQSLNRKGVIDDIVGQYGHVIIDECHHVSAFSFEEVIRYTKARFITGLSATLTRKDGHHPIITMRCGPVRYSVTAKEQTVQSPFEHYIHVRPTSFASIKPRNDNVRIQFSELYEELIKDEQRNQLICSDVIHAVKENRSPLVLTERNDHLDTLFQMLVPQVQHVIVLRGGMGIKMLAQTLQHLKTIPEGEGRVVLATGKFVGEGFDEARLDTLFLTLPISWYGTVAQYVGRLHRLHDAKKEVHVYDYADLSVTMLERMFNRRCRAYETIGYQILLPASAVRGWPTDMPLPIDAKWKSHYSTAVKRLVEDGIDLPLAGLFKEATDNSLFPSPDCDQARSLCEAFLFKRLETLPQTTRRFRLNVEIPIPFNNLGSMEVDLLCVDACIAIEIDGSQHLADANCWRRDRYKDALLQEHGYMVLRFLAEDVMKQLDMVLDRILRALTRRVTMLAGT